MREMDKDIYKNPTLGEASNVQRLDVFEAQEKENRRARIEGREPMTVVSDNTHPNWTPGAVSSSYNSLKYAELPNGIHAVPPEEKDRSESPPRKEEKDETEKPSPTPANSGDEKPDTEKQDEKQGSSPQAKQGSHSGKASSAASKEKS